MELLDERLDPPPQPIMSARAWGTLFAPPKRVTGRLYLTEACLTGRLDPSRFWLDIPYPSWDLKLRGTLVVPLAEIETSELILGRFSGPRIELDLGNRRTFIFSLGYPIPWPFFLPRTSTTRRFFKAMEEQRQALEGGDERAGTV